MSTREPTRGARRSVSWFWIGLCKVELVFVVYDFLIYEVMKRIVIRLRTVEADDA